MLAGSAVEIYLAASEEEVM
jgi:hypothetical protein